MSDHYLVIATRYLRYPKDQKVSFTGRSYRDYTFERAKKYYSKKDTSHIYHMIDVDLVWAKLKNYMINCSNVLCLIREIHTRTNKPKWLTNGILELVKDWDDTFTEAYET